MTRFSETTGGAIMERTTASQGPRVYFDVDDINAGVCPRQGARRRGERRHARPEHGLVRDLQGHRRKRLRPLADRPVGVDVVRRKGHVLGTVPGTCPERRSTCRRRRAQLGSVTTRRSPSSATSPPSARDEPDGDRRTEILGRLAEDDRRRLAVTGSIATRGRRPKRRPRRRRDGPRRAGARPAPARPARDRPGRPRRCRGAVGGERERVRLAHDRVVAAALDPRGEREQVEQLGQLVGGGVDQAEIADALVLVELVHPQHRLREALHGRERRAQVMAGERDEAGEVVGHGAASVTA